MKRTRKLKNGVRLVTEIVTTKQGRKYTFIYEISSDGIISYLNNDWKSKNCCYNCLHCNNNVDLSNAIVNRKCSIRKNKTVKCLNSCNSWKQAPFKKHV